MNLENKKDYLIGFLWLIYGYLCWVSSVYIFAYGTSNLVQPVFKYIKNISPQFLTFTNFLLFYSTGFLLIVLFAFILSFATGNKLLWLIAFLIGNLSQSIYESIQSLMFYKNYYEKLPSWVTSSFTQEIMAYLFITPLITWLGMFLGNKYRTRKSITNHSTGRGINAF